MLISLSQYRFDKKMRFSRWTARRKNLTTISHDSMKIGNRSGVPRFSTAAGLKSGQSNQKRNFSWANFIKSEYRSTAKKRNGFLSLKKQLDPGEIRAKKISLGRQDQQDRENIAQSWKLKVEDPPLSGGLKGKG